VKLSLINFHLIDGVSDEPLSDAAVVIEGGRIIEVSNGVPVAAGEATIVDCQGGWLLPGLWDVHAHPGYPGPTPKDLVSRVIQYGHHLTEALMESGITSVRTVGTEEWIDVAWREAFASGQHIGPRVFAGGHFLTTTGGHGLGWPYAIQCDGPNSFLKAVRREIMHGVDHVKFNLSGGIMGPSWDSHTHSFWLKEELEAAFRLCRQRDVRVVCHATNPQAVKDAIEMGAWSVEHGYIMDAGCIGLMLEKGTYYVPTLGLTHLTPEQASDPWEKWYVEFRNRPADYMARADAASLEHARWFKAALTAGVSMAVGSDLGPLTVGTLLEMGLWVKEGATPMQAIKGATAMAARVCCVDQDLGTVEAGKIADLILVRDNPLENIANLRTLQMVFKEGKLVSDKREARV
jgi:imidazolonepropionase-like amidohydrolase